MFLYGVIILPIPVTPSDHESVYEILLATLPEAVFELVEGIRFGLLLHYKHRMNLDIRSIHVSPKGS